MDTFSGTHFDTVAAGGAFVVVNDSVIVYHVNCVVRADLFTLTTADTAVFADADSFFGVEMAGANDFYSLVIVKHTDEDVYKRQIFLSSVRRQKGCPAALSALIKKSLA